jgi:hypothetical protein
MQRNKNLSKTHRPKAHPGCFIPRKEKVKKLGLSNNTLKYLLLKGGSLKKFKALLELISAKLDPIIIAINIVNTMRS